MLNVLRSLGQQSLRDKRRQEGHSIRFFFRFLEVLVWYAETAVQQLTCKSTAKNWKTYQLGSGQTNSQGILMRNDTSAKTAFQRLGGGCSEKETKQMSSELQIKWASLEKYFRLICGSELHRDTI